MPLEDEIITENKGPRNEGGGMQSFLESAQSAIAEAVAKGAAEKLVDGMFSSSQHRGNPTQQGQPQDGGLYPDLHEGHQRNSGPSVLDTAQSAFADAFAKRTAERVVDGILPPSQNRQPEGPGGYGQSHNQQDAGQSGFDLSSIGSSLLESLSGQVLHSSDKQVPQQRPPQQEQSGFDLGSVGSELLSSLTDQVIHPKKTSQEQQYYSPRQDTTNQNETENQSGFDLGKVGSELLGSLAKQVLHPSDEKCTDDQSHSQKRPVNSANSAESGFDLGKVGSELLGSLADQVLHPDKREQAVTQQSSNNHASPANQSGGDIGSIIGSLAENVFSKGKQSQENNGASSHTNQPHSFSDTAGEVAASVFGSLADSVLKASSNNDREGYGSGSQGYGPGPQGYGPGPQGYGPGPQGYGPGPQGYGPGPQGYGPGPQGYGPGPQGYGPGPQGYGPGPQAYGPDPQGYGPEPQAYGPGLQGYGPGPEAYAPRLQGYGPGAQGYGPRPQGYGPGPQGYGPGPRGYDPGPGSQQYADKEANNEDSTANIGSLVNSLASKVLQPHHQ